MRSIQNLQSQVSIQSLQFRSVRLELTQVNDELGDLETSDPLLPGDSNPASTLEVVPVHHNVNSQIQCDRNP